MWKSKFENKIYWICKNWKLLRINFKVGELIGHIFLFGTHVPYLLTFGICYCKFSNPGDQLNSISKQLKFLCWLKIMLSFEFEHFIKYLLIYWLNRLLDDHANIWHIFKKFTDNIWCSKLTCSIFLSLSLVLR